MKEIQYILELARAAGDEPLAIATVVNVRGSAYRRPGARMLITALGETAGMISGGCLEGDVRERALQVISSGRSELATYDSTSSEDIIFGLGLGCNGIVQVLIEPVSQNDGGLLAFLRASYEQREPAHLITVFHATGAAAQINPGWALLRCPKTGVVTSSPAWAAALPSLGGMQSDKRFEVQQVVSGDSDTISLLLETILPPVSLLICGGGDDAIPLAALAKHLRWHVTVLDARAALVTRDRFPKVDVIECVRPESFRNTTASPLVMLMTHSYSQDKVWLRLWLSREWSYLGILGPKSRTRRLLDELAAEGCVASDEQIGAIHGPAGLDIGAESPDEVALSVLAEMQAVVAGRSGGPLRSRDGPIHDPVVTP